MIPSKKTTKKSGKNSQKSQSNNFQGGSSQAATKARKGFSQANSTVRAGYSQGDSHASRSIAQNINIQRGAATNNIPHQGRGTPSQVQDHGVDQDSNEERTFLSPETQYLRNITLHLDSEKARRIAEAGGDWGGAAFTNAFPRAEEFLFPDGGNTNMHIHSDHDSEEEEDIPEGPIQGGSSEGANRINETIPIPGYFPASEDRPLIVPFGYDSFIPATVTDGIIADCISINFKPGWTTISTVKPISEREPWFARFRQKYRWAPDDEDKIKQNFFRKCGKLLRDSWADYFRGKSKRGPLFACPQTIRLATEMREKPEWKEMSKRNKSNYLGTKNNLGPSRHRMGRKPAHHHKKLMEKDLKRPPTPLEFYKRYKILDDGTHLHPNGQQIVRHLEERIGDNQDGSSQRTEAENVEVMADIVGINPRTKLPRVLGSAASFVEGSRFHNSTQPTVHSHASGGIDLSSMLQKMNETLSQQVEEVAKAREDAQKAREEAHAAREEAERARADAERERTTLVTSITTTIQKQIAESVARALAGLNTHPPPH